MIAQGSHSLRVGMRLGMMRRLSEKIRRRAGDIRRFCSAERGTTAVEFALIGPLFIATLVAVFQTCIFLFAQMVLQNAAQQAGRYYMTGQAQNNNWTASTVVGKVCPTALFNCNNMYMVVQNYSSFSGASTSPPQMYNNGSSSPVTRIIPVRRAPSWSCS